MEEKGGRKDEKGAKEKRKVNENIIYYLYRNENIIFLLYKKKRKTKILFSFPKRKITIKIYR